LTTPRSFLRRLVPALVLIATMAVAAPASATAPPSGSPAALGQHPRLFFTGTELSGMRTRISTYYRTEFQSFLDLLANTGSLSSGQQAIENEWGCMNFAFLAALDPALMRSLGFTVNASMDTKAECATRAMNYARPLLSRIATAAGQSHSDLTTGYPTTLYFTVMTVYDWCYADLPSADRAAIVNAFVSAYDVKYKGQNTLTMEISGLEMLCNNQSSADIHDILGITAFYGDPYPSSSTQQELYTAFDNIWMQRVLVELNYLYGSGTNWHEGSGGYFGEGFLNLGLPIGMVSSALGESFPATTPFFYRYPEFAEANVKPLGTSSRCGSSGTQRCPDYMERWGTISGGIESISCKAAMLVSGMLRKSSHPAAALAKHVWETTAGGCTTSLTTYGGIWSNAVLWYFIYGDKEVNALSPSALGTATAQRLGLGEYVLRSDYGPDASQVVFWGKPVNMYGHDSDDYGHFTLHKYGNLIVTAANSKSGDAVLSSAKFNLLMNSVGIHKGSSDPTLSFDGVDTNDPFFGARGFTKIRKAGRVRAEVLNAPVYDYVGYDNADSWSSATATISQRELVYLKGPVNSEYVVVMDRVRTPDPTADDKVWKIWVPAQPAFVNGSPSAPRAGKWTSTSTDLMSLTNQRTGLQTSRFTSADTHGKFFLKTLLPANPRINVLGGPGKEFQSGDDDGSTPWGAPSMTAGMWEYLGWGRIEVRPSASSTYDAFLNVIQFGDAGTLSTMAPTMKVASENGAMVGAEMRDSRTSRVVLFSAAEDGAVVTGPVRYTFTPASTISEHLLVNVQPSLTYYLATSGSGSNVRVTLETAPVSGATPVVSGSQGVLAFQLAGLVVGDRAPPSAIQDLRSR
jgi:hypothetical protein